MLEKLTGKNFTLKNIKTENKVSQPVSIDEKEDATNNPLISIITPVLNGIKYSEICIQSVLNRNYPYIEHIFVDGTSTDGTLDILSSYKTKYPDRIRFVSEQDKSAGDAWNKGLVIARGKILGWLGSDNTYEPTAIMTVVEFFKTNPDAYFVFDDCNYINKKGEIIGKAQTKDFDLEEAINNTCYIPCPSAFYKREVIEKVCFMDTRETGVELDYWIRAGKVFQIHRIDKILSMHKDSISGSKETGKIYALEGFIISRRHGGSIFSPCGIRYLIYKSVIFVRPLSILVSIYHFIKRSSKK